MTGGRTATATDAIIPILGFRENVLTSQMQHVLPTEPFRDQIA